MPDERSHSAILDILSSIPAVQELQAAWQEFEAMQERLAQLQDDRGEQDLLAIRIGTMLVFALVQKAAEGTKPFDLSHEDWEDVARAVAEYAVIPDGSQYSVFIFQLYANYIDASAGLLEDRAQPSSLESIRELSSRLLDLADSFADGEIAESDYVEESLWICLEALIKLLATMAGSLRGPEGELVAQSLAEMGVAYGRMKLAAQEQALLDACLAAQQEIDSTLAAKLDQYRTAVESEKAEFLQLVDDAFTAGIEDRLKRTATLARAAGVDEERILDSGESIDAYFLE